MASRLVRVEERRERRKLSLAIFGSIALLGFLAFFGLRLLVGFSLLVDKLRGGSSATTAEFQQIILPPVLNPLPKTIATNEITVTGSANPGLTLLLYIDEAETKKATVAESGTFSFTFTLVEGMHTISAKLTDGKGNISELSDVLTLTIKKTPPVLEVSTPGDGDRITGDSPVVTISGKTEEGSRVTVNDRLIIVQSDGTFKTTFNLPEGETILRIIAVDEAGNQTEVNRKVTYQK